MSTHFHELFAFRGILDFFLLLFLSKTFWDTRYNLVYIFGKCDIDDKIHIAYIQSVFL